MAIIVMTWSDPPQPEGAKFANTQAQGWRQTVLKQPGLIEYNAFAGISTGKFMAVDTFASPTDAAAFLGSRDFATIVNEMRAAGVTDIQTTLWDQHPDVPESLRAR